MSRLRIEITKRALGQMDAAEAWWRRNRDKAPRAFAEELRDTLRFIGDQPLAGAPWRGRRRNLRRVYLPRTQYHLYYTVEGDRITILSLWHASRRPPSL